jgi:MATE family multidrug resistance protein
MVVLGICSLGCVAVSSLACVAICIAQNVAHRLGPTALAAQSVLLVSCTIAFQTPYSLGIATTVRVGNLLGSGYPQKAKLAAETSIGMSVVTALVLR